MDILDEVRRRLQRARSIFEEAGIQYAIIGGNAVMSWVTTRNPEAIRFTRDVDVMIRRDDLDAVKKAFEKHGFKYRHVAGMDVLLEAGGKIETGIHLLFSGEKLRESDQFAMPEISTGPRSPLEYEVISLEALVQMKLMSYRAKDITHLQDMSRVGLIDRTWPEMYPPELAARLRVVLDDPESQPYPALD